MNKFINKKVEKEKTKENNEVLKGFDELAHQGGRIPTREEGRKSIIRCFFFTCGMAAGKQPCIGR
jgi:hypothetical protein